MALGAGSIAFVGYNGDGNDNIAFVALADIAAGTEIFFTDNSWNGTSFGTTESIFKWTASSAVAAGTVININSIGSGTATTNNGAVVFTSSTNRGLSNDSEVVYAYIGTAGAPTFLAAISNVGYATSDGNLNGTGLTVGQTAISLPGSGNDIGAYNGVRAGLTSYANYLTSINNTANWVTQNGSGDQSADGTSPDAPFPTTGFTVTAPAGQTVSFSPASVAANEGNSGTQTLTFTVTRDGGTTGALAFSGTFAAGTTNAADFGGTLPASTFNGTIADGAISVTITITISGDTLAETNEAFTLTLTSASNPNATVTIGTASATGTITNDDGTLISSNTTTAQTLANNDHLTVASGVTLSGSTPVTWIAGSTTPGAVLDNFGTIAGTDRAIYTTTSAVSGSLTVNNAAGAMITATKDAIKIANLTSGQTGTVTINNDGTIRSTGTGGDAGQALDLDTVASSGVHVVINNSATGLIQAADADAIRPGSNATVNNSGQIRALNGNDAIDFQDTNTGGTVNNLAGGVIDGGRHGVTAKQAITVSNAGTINGQLGAGINLDTVAGVMSFVTNSGLITGHAAGATDGDGVDVDGLVTLDNSGTIEAFGTSSASLSEALAIGGGSVHNRASGIITSEQRAITVDNSDGGSAFGAMTIVNEGLIKGGSGEAIAIAGDFADTLTNSGQILGSVSLGGGADTLTNSGQISGNVTTGAGNDIVNLSVGSTIGTLDGGEGDDTVKLTGIGTGVLGATTGVEKLLVQEGSWSITDNAVNFSDITIKSGATVTSSIQVGDGDHLIVEAGGKVQMTANGVIGVSWLGGQTTIDNYGLIAASSFTNNAIRGQSASGQLTVNNYEGAEVRGLFAVSGAFFNTGSSLELSNAGKMSQIDVRSDTAHVTVENLATGLILSDQANRKMVRIGGNVDFSNAGLIQSAADTPTSNGGDAVIYEGIRGTHVSITNLTGGRIEGSRHAVTGDSAATIVNQAGGVMVGRNGSAVNIDNNGTEEQKVYVTNYGTMEGRSATYADSDGDAIDVDGLAQILNYGSIRGLGANGRHDGEPNVSEGIAFGGGTILNYGANAEIYGYGRAIQVDNSSNSNAFGKTLINNEGLIKGDGHGPEGVTFTPEEVIKFDLRGNEAIKLVGDYDDEILNQSTGRIVGGVSMGGGNDHLQSLGSFTATGGSAIDMGAGNDTVYFYTGTTVQGSVLLGTGDDLLLATAAGGFVIDAGDGNDQIYLDSSYSGNDVITGGIGDDTIYAGAGNDEISGGADNDTLSGENGDDLIQGGAGDDTIMGGAGADTLRGDDGNDTIQAGTGDIVDGGADNDVIEVAAETGAPASIDGGEGDDTVKLLGTGIGALGATTAVESLVVQSGTWSVAGSESYSDITIEDGATVTSQVNVSGADKLTVEQGGTLNVNSASGNGVSIEGATTDVVIDNAGLIHSGPAAAHAIGGDFGSDPQSVKIINRAAGVISSEWQATIAFSSDYEASGGGSIEIENAGLIESQNTTVIQLQDLYDTTATINNLAGGIIRGSHNGDVMRLGAGAVLNNAGTIVNAETGSFFGDAVDFQNSTGGVVNNLAGGLIEGSRHGITGKSNVTITNEEGATIYGRNGSGVNFDTDEEDQIFSITNHGTIRGAAMQDDPDTEDSDIDGDGVDVDYTVLLHNYGRIEALGAKGYKDGFENFSEGVAAGGGEIYNHAGGVIFSVDNGILIDDGEEGSGYAATLIDNDGIIEGRDGYGIKLVGEFDDTVFNKGTIKGGDGLAIDMGAGDDVVVNFTGGIIQGAIVLGEGDDQFFGNESAENVDGGQGSDLLTGGGGGDTLGGGEGSDVYSYSLGEGSDTIVEGVGAAGDTDLLMFDEVEAAGATLRKHGADVEIVLANGDVITLKDQLAGGGVENIVFSDGVILGRDDVEAALVNRGPVAADDALNAVAEDAPSFLISFAGLLGNDTDADLDGLTITDVSSAVGGTFTIEAGGIRFTPTANYNGDASFTYTVNDGHGGTSQATVSFTVTSMNDGPTVTAPVPVVTNEDTAVIGQIVASDIEGDALTYVVKTDGGPAHGAVTLDANGNWTYTPNANYNGSDSFTVLISDGQATVEAVVTVGVTAVNDGPVANDDILNAVVEDAPSFLISFADLLGNDTDADLDGLTITDVSSAVGGAFTIEAGGIRFTPAANYHGPASFAYTVTDTAGGTSVATASFTITSVEDVPVVVTSAPATTAEDTQVTGQIVASDGDGDALTFAVKTGAGPAHGGITIDANGNWTYTPDHNFNGPDSFTIVVSDGDDLVETVVNLSVTPANDAPTAVNDTGTAGENETKLFDVLANDSDVDGGVLSLSGFSVTGVSGIALNNTQVQAAFSVQNGQLAFNPGNLFDGLNDGDAATVTLNYTVQDANGASSTAEFVLTVNGSTDGHVIVGSNAADPLFGTEGVDIIDANDGNDTVFGRGGNDIIDAGNGTDVVFGGAGSDVIDGGAGKDTLFGDTGNDVLAGGQGNDLLYGGAGNDTFVFHAGEGRDIVYDFQAGAGASDVIELDHSLFADFEALMAAGAITDTSIGAQISYGDGSTITLSNVHKADLAVDDFRFA